MGYLLRIVVRQGAMRRLGEFKMAATISACLRNACIHIQIEAAMLNSPDLVEPCQTTTQRSNSPCLAYTITIKKVHLTRKGYKKHSTRSCSQHKKTVAKQSISCAVSDLNATHNHFIVENALSSGSKVIAIVRNP